MARAFRVFLSSTFGDLARERTVLGLEIFPRVHLRCARRGGSFRTVDLRWGISEAASRERRTMDVCLGEVRRCLAASPDFNLILLLGDRYGWRPLPAQIDGEAFETMVAAVTGSSRDLLRSAFRLDENARPGEYVLLPRPSQVDGHEAAVRTVLDEALAVAYGEDDPRQVAYAASATHLEVAEALTAAGAPGNLLVFARERVDRAADADDEEDRRRLEAFDTALVARLGADAVLRYSLADDPDLHAFGERVEEALLRRTEQVEEAPIAGAAQAVGQVSLPAVGRDYIDATALCRAICAQRTRTIVGPDAVTRALADHLRADGVTPLVVLAPAGGGKTTALARALLAEPADGEVQVVGRLAGAVPEWTSLDEVLRGLLTEIDGEGGAPQPAGGLELERAFAERLTTPRERPLRIYLDGVDQLDTPGDTDRATLRFVPPTLAPGVTLVLSATEADDEQGAVARALRDLLPEDAFIELPTLSTDDADTLLDRWLEDAGRTVQPGQRSVLLDRFHDQPLPLLLRLVTDQALRWRSYDEPVLGERVEGVVRAGVASLADDADHGPVLVDAALADLAAARFGLSDNEVLALLTQDPVVMADLAERSPYWPLAGVLPYVVWARLRADLAPYVSDRAVDGETLSAFGSATVRRVLADTVAARLTEAHGRLVRLFTADPETGALSSRVLSERPFQLTRAALWPDLAATLGDPAFVEAKCSGGRTGDLVDDYRRARAAAHAASLDEDDPYLATLSTWSTFVLRQRAALEQFAGVDGFTRQQICNEGLADAAVMPPHPGRVWLSRDRSVDLTEPIVTALPGHTRGATDCVFDRSGALLYSGGMDGQVLAWSTRDWSLVDIVAELDASADSCDVSPDGTLVATACADGRVRIHGLRRRTVVVCEPGFDLGPRRCRFTTDGLTLVAVGRPGIAIYDVGTGALVRSGLSEEIVNDCTILDADTAAVGDCDGRVHLVDLATCEARRHVWLDEVRRAQGASASPDGRLLVVAGGTFSSEDDMAPFGERDMFDTGTWQQVEGHFERLDHPALNCVFVDEGRHYVVGLSDGAVRVYRTDGGALVATHKSHDSGVRGMALSPDGRMLATAAYDGAVKIWDVAALTSALVTPAGGRGLFAVVDRVGRGWAVTATVDNYSATFAVTAVPAADAPNVVLQRPRWLANLTLDRRDPGLPIRTFTWDVPAVADRAGHPTSPPTRPGRHWLVHTPARIQPDAFHLLPELDPPLWSAENATWTISADGSYLGLVRTRPEEIEGQLMRRVDLLTYLIEPWGRRPLVEATTYLPLGWQVGSCGFSPTLDRFQVALGAGIGDLTLLPGSQVELVGVQEDAEEKAEGDPEPLRAVRAFACSPDGTCLAAAYGDGLLRVFDLASGALRYTTQAHPAPTVDCAYLDDHTLVTIGTDSTLRLWSAPDVALHAVFVADNALAAFDLDAASRRLLAVDVHGKATMLTVVGR